jgi:hypothetical protein
VISDVEGLHFIYFDPTGVLTDTTAFSLDLILRWGIASMIYWDATNNVVVPNVQDERHGTIWPSSLHLQQHVTVGCVYQDGLDVSTTADGDGSLSSHAEISCSSGHIWDEDLQHLVSGHLGTDPVTKIYRSGSASYWRIADSSSSIVCTSGTGRAAYNQNVAGTWQLTEMTDGYYGVAYLYVHPGLGTQYLIVVGSAEYATLELVKAAAASRPSLGVLPAPEYRIVAAMLFQTASTYTNSTKSRILSYADGVGYVDWRFSTGQGVLNGGQGPQGLPGAPGNTNVVVSATDPGLTEAGLWIQTGLGPTGDGISFWLEDGL